jgi:hypothetical protein
LLDHFDQFGEEVRIGKYTNQPQNKRRTEPLPVARALWRRSANCQKMPGFWKTLAYYRSSGREASQGPDIKRFVVCVSSVSPKSIPIGYLQFYPSMKGDRPALQLVYR